MHRFTFHIEQRCQGWQCRVGDTEVQEMEPSWQGAHPAGLGFISSTLEIKVLHTCSPSPWRTKARHQKSWLQMTLRSRTETGQLLRPRSLSSSAQCEKHKCGPLDANFMQFLGIKHRVLHGEAGQGEGCRMDVVLKGGVSFALDCRTGRSSESKC